ncbi:MAG: hypothetical protein WDW38_004931 [Sanguina aurantia]
MPFSFPLAQNGNPVAAHSSSGDSTRSSSADRGKRSSGSSSSSSSSSIPFGRKQLKSRAGNARAPGNASQAGGSRSVGPELSSSNSAKVRGRRPVKLSQVPTWSLDTEPPTRAAAGPLADVLDLTQMQLAHQAPFAALAPPAPHRISLAHAQATGIPVCIHARASRRKLRHLTLQPGGFDPRICPASYRAGNSRRPTQPSARWLSHTARRAAPLHSIRPACGHRPAVLQHPAGHSLTPAGLSTPRAHPCTAQVASPLAPQLWDLLRSPSAPGPWLERADELSPQVVVAASLAYLSPAPGRWVDARSAARMLRYLDMRDDVVELIGTTEAMQLVAVLGLLEGEGVRVRCPRVRTWAMQTASSSSGPGRTLRAEEPACDSGCQPACKSHMSDVQGAPRHMPAGAAVQRPHRPPCRCPGPASNQSTPLLNARFPCLPMPCPVQLLSPGTQQAARLDSVGPTLHPSLSPAQQTWLLHSLGTVVCDPGCGPTAPAYTSALLRSLLHSAGSDQFTASAAAATTGPAGSSSDPPGPNTPRRSCSTGGLVAALLAAASHVEAVAAVEADEAGSGFGNSGGGGGGGGGSQPLSSSSSAAQSLSMQGAQGTALLSTVQQLVQLVTRVEVLGWTVISDQQQRDQAISTVSGSETGPDKEARQDNATDTAQPDTPGRLPNHREGLQMWSDLAELACVYRCSLEGAAVQLAAQSVIRTLSRFSPTQSAATPNSDGPSPDTAYRNALAAFPLDRAASAAGGWLLPHLYASSDPAAQPLRQQMLQLLMQSPTQSTQSRSSPAGTRSSASGPAEVGTFQVQISDDTQLSLSGPFLMSLSRSGCSSESALADVASALLGGVEARVAAQASGSQPLFKRRSDAGEQQRESAGGEEGSWCSQGCSRVLAMGMRCVAQLGKRELDQGLWEAAAIQIDHHSSADLCDFAIASAASAACADAPERGGSHSDQQDRVARAPADDDGSSASAETLVLRRAESQLSVYEFAEALLPRKPTMQIPPPPPEAHAAVQFPVVRRCTPRCRSVPALEVGVSRLAVFYAACISARPQPPSSSHPLVLTTLSLFVPSHRTAVALAITFHASPARSPLLLNALQALALQAQPGPEPPPAQSHQGQDPDPDINLIHRSTSSSSGDRSDSSSSDNSGSRTSGDAPPDPAATHAATSEAQQPGPAATTSTTTRQDTCSSAQEDPQPSLPQRAAPAPQPQEPSSVVSPTQAGPVGLGQPLLHLSRGEALPLARCALRHSHSHSHSHASLPAAANLALDLLAPHCHGLSQGDLLSLMTSPSLALLGESASRSFLTAGSVRLMGRVGRIPTAALLRLLRSWPALGWRPALLLRRVVLLALDRVKEDESRPVVQSSDEEEEQNPQNWVGSMDPGDLIAGEGQQSRLQLRPHDAISLVKCLAALSYRSEPVCALLKAVLQRTLKLHRSTVLVFSVKQLASLVWSCARLSYRSDALLLPLLQLVTRSPREELTMPVVASVVWACGRLGLNSEKLAASSARLCLSQLGRASNVERANLAWGLMKLGWASPPPRNPRPLTSRLAAIPSALLPTLDFTLLSRFLFSCTQSRFIAPDLLQSYGDAVCSMLDRDAAGSPAQEAEQSPFLCSVVYGFAMQGSPGPPRMLALLEDVATRRPRMFTPWQRAGILWGFSCLSYIPTAWFRLGLAKFIARDIPLMSLKELSMTLVALSRWPLDDLTSPRERLALLQGAVACGIALLPEVLVPTAEPISIGSMTAAVAAAAKGRAAAEQQQLAYPPLRGGMSSISSMSSMDGDEEMEEALPRRDVGLESLPDLVAAMATLKKYSPELMTRVAAAIVTHLHSGSSTSLSPPSSSSSSPPSPDASDELASFDFAPTHTASSTQGQDHARLLLPPRRQHATGSMRPKALTSLLWGFATLKHDDPPLMEAAGDALTAAAELMATQADAASATAAVHSAAEATAAPRARQSTPPTDSAPVTAAASDPPPATTPLTAQLPPASVGIPTPSSTALPPSKPSQLNPPPVPRGSSAVTSTTAKNSSSSSSASQPTAQPSSSPSTPLPTAAAVDPVQEALQAYLTAAISEAVPRVPVWSGSETFKLLWAWGKLNRHPGPRVMSAALLSWQVHSHRQHQHPSTSHASPRSVMRHTHAAEMQHFVKPGQRGHQLRKERLSKQDKEKPSLYLDEQGTPIHWITGLLYSLALMQQHTGPFATLLAQQLCSIPDLQRHPGFLKQRQQLAACLLAAQADRTESPLMSLLPPEARALALEQWRARASERVAATPNNHQSEICGVLKKMGVSTKTNSPTTDGVAVADVLLLLPNSTNRFVLELVGKHNSAANSPRLLGEAALKYRLLQARGYIVIPINCREWDKIGRKDTTSQMYYLQTKLERRVAALSGAGLAAVMSGPVSSPAASAASASAASASAASAGKGPAAEPTITEVH